MDFRLVEKTIYYIVYENTLYKYTVIEFQFLVAEKLSQVTIPRLIGARDKFQRTSRSDRAIVYVKCTLRWETSTTVYRLYCSRRCLGYCARNANAFGVINAVAASALMLATSNNPFPFKILIPGTITLR